jgi:hypothetical protein
MPVDTNANAPYVNLTAVIWFVLLLAGVLAVLRAFLASRRRSRVARRSSRRTVRPTTTLALVGLTIVVTSILDRMF